jgi:hypothetical protein
MAIGTLIAEATSKGVKAIQGLARGTENQIGKVFPRLIPKVKSTEEIVEKTVAAPTGWFGKMWGNKTFTRIRGGTTKAMGVATAGFGVYGTAKGIATKSLDGALDGLSMITAALSFIPEVNILAAIIQMGIAIPRFVGSMVAGKGLKVSLMKAGADALFGLAEFIPGGGIVRLLVGAVGSTGLTMLASSAEAKKEAANAKAEKKLGNNRAVEPAGYAATQDSPPSTEWRNRIAAERQRMPVLNDPQFDKATQSMLTGNARN